MILVKIALDDCHGENSVLLGSNNYNDDDYSLTVTMITVFSARQHICYSALYAIARPSVRPSVRLSVRHTGGSVKDV